MVDSGDGTAAAAAASTVTAENENNENGETSTGTTTTLSSAPTPAPAATTDDPDRVLRFGDLVRIVGKQVGKPDNRGSLGKVLRSVPIGETKIDERHLLSSHPFVYDVELILGGKLSGWQRPTLQYTTAEAEGMTGEARRRKRKQTTTTTTTITSTDTTRPTTAKKKKATPSNNKKAKKNTTSSTGKKSSTKKGSSTGKRGTSGKSTSGGKDKNSKGGKAKRQKTLPENNDDGCTANNNAAAAGEDDMYERHKREFEKCVTRLEKADAYQYFSSPDIPSEFDEFYDSNNNNDDDGNDSNNGQQKQQNENNVVFPHHPPFNLIVLRKRMEKGRYELDQELLEIEDRIELIRPYYEERNKALPIENDDDFNDDDRDKNAIIGQPQRPVPQFTNGFTVLHKRGVNWDLFRMDVRGMCDQAVRRNSELVIDDGTPGSLSHSAKKIKDVLDQMYDKTGKKQMSEIEVSNDRHRFSLAFDSVPNNEAAMQGKWKKDAFDERKYERLSSNVVCAGLSAIDEKIAQYELNTTLKDSFVGLSYTYDDTGQSEGWMKNIFNDSDVTPETASAAMDALASDDGVIKAQVSAAMQALLIAVQDRVMTDNNVLSQPELRSANWDAGTGATTMDIESTKQIISKAISKTSSMPDIIEQPVWGMDCYTRRNISICIETEFDGETAVTFVEKWLLPAINACPVDMAHDIQNAACILEGIPFETGLPSDQFVSTTLDAWSKTLLGAALKRKIQKMSPPWLASAAQLLRRAVAAIGSDFFRVHPKGHGSIVLCPRIEPNRLVTFYRGEVYPSWRWGEKTDAISLIQERKGLKPRLPDFYNMALERPQIDPRGYGLLFVDASRKSGYGSMLSHSCTPSCEVRVVAADGKVALAMTTLRELTLGDELTFDYNAVTESLHEYQSAVCLCGHARCRGSFLHFATADCYQQILNRNSPVAVRLSQLIKGSTKRIMSDDDTRILKRHGFQTAAFGAVSVNRRCAVAQDLQDHALDSLDFVPIWLRTFTADLLRYIEYERRALPIALICNDLKIDELRESDDSDSDDASSESEAETENTEIQRNKKDKKPVKGSKPEPSFFFFAKKKRAQFLAAAMEEKENALLKGVALEIQIKKVASLAWKELDEKSKGHWKSLAFKAWEENGGREKARLEEERLKRIAEAKDQLSAAMTVEHIEKSSGRKGAKKKRPVKTKSQKKKEVTFSTNGMSFQAADAEGVSAMEQRIQQLTQTLSRVGRVLDRHREESLRKRSLNSGNDASILDSPAELRELAHSPLTMMKDEEVVAWMWNHPDGIVQSLMKLSNDEICVSPWIKDELSKTQERFSTLSQFGAPWDPSYERPLQFSIPGTEARKTLNEALMALRKVLLDGMAVMASDVRARKKKKNEDEIRSEIGQVLDGMVSMIVHRIEGSDPDGVPPEETASPTIDCWFDYYNKRFKIEKAADLLLLYARTSTFFRLKTYESLKSTPIEVYAREIGNAVPRSVMDTLDDGDKSGVRNNKKTDICEPDDIISEVVVEYQGDYVLSQLLQWYNAGVDQKPGLPDLLGCALLPSMSGCWTIDSTKGSKSATVSTAYKLRTRPKLVDWLQDAQKRGSPWPDDIRRHFVDKENDRPIQNASDWIPLGSPVMDLLVTGDDSNILDILSKMGRSARSETSDSLLSSVDHGRPAQAVSNWVQCDRPECQKWRKVPWHVDIDMLSESFVCADNVWNPERASCEAPEDEWDEEIDACVDVDGSLKEDYGNDRADNTPEVDTTPLRLSELTVGTDFDVFRASKGKWSKATVVATDVTGEKQRFKFRFLRTATLYSKARNDEWVDFDSGRIARLNTHTDTKGQKQSEPKTSSHKTLLSPNLTAGTTASAFSQTGVDDENTFEGDTETSGDESTKITETKDQVVEASDDDGLNDFGSDDDSGVSDEKSLEAARLPDVRSGDVGISSADSIVTDEPMSQQITNNDVGVRQEDPSDQASAPTDTVISQSMTIPKKSKEASTGASRIPKKRPANDEHVELSSPDLVISRSDKPNLYGSHKNASSTRADSMSTHHSSPRKSPESMPTHHSAQSSPAHKTSNRSPDRVVEKKVQGRPIDPRLRHKKEAQESKLDERVDRRGMPTESQSTGSRSREDLLDRNERIPASSLHRQREQQYPLRGNPHSVPPYGHARHIGEQHAHDRWNEQDRRQFYRPAESFRDRDGRWEHGDRSPQHNYRDRSHNHPDYEWSRDRDRNDFFRGRERSAEYDPSYNNTYDDRNRRVQDDLPRHMERRMLREHHNNPERNNISPRRQYDSDERHRRPEYDRQENSRDHNRQESPRRKYDRRPHNAYEAEYDDRRSNEHSNYQARTGNREEDGYGSGHYRDPYDHIRHYRDDHVRPRYGSPQKPRERVKRQQRGYEVS